MRCRPTRSPCCATCPPAARPSRWSGDGNNDGPALAAADLALALGSGTDVAITAADLILLRDDLGAVPDGIGLARATFTTIRRNIAWAFGYNVAAIPLAAAGLLNPIIAAAAMALSSAFVVSNSVRLRRFASPGAGTARARRRGSRRRGGGGRSGGTPRASRTRAVRSPG